MERDVPNLTQQVVYARYNLNRNEFASDLFVWNYQPNLPLAYELGRGLAKRAHFQTNVLLFMLLSERTSNHLRHVPGTCPTTNWLMINTAR